MDAIIFFFTTTQPLRPELLKRCFTVVSDTGFSRHLFLSAQISEDLNRLFRLLVTTICFS